LKPKYPANDRIFPKLPLRSRRRPAGVQATSQGFMPYGHTAFPSFACALGWVSRAKRAIEPVTANASQH
jgi:hypothetical protein